MLPDPPAFVQLSEYTYEPTEFIAPLLWEPDDAFVPLHEPPAVHELGLLVALQEIVEELPVLIDVGLTEILTTGIAMTVSDADPDPEPAEFEQLSE